MGAVNAYGRYRRCECNSPYGGRGKNEYRVSGWSGQDPSEGK